MSLPVGSEHAAAPAAVPAPSTLRNSRRLTPAPLEGDSLMSVVTIGAVVASPFPFGRRRHRAARIGGVARRALSRHRIVTVDVTVHAPTHVERRVLVDTVHRL